MFYLPFWYNGGIPVYHTYTTRSHLPLNICNAPLPWAFSRYGKLRVAHAPGMPGTFSPPPTSEEITSYRSRHASRHVRHARAVMHVGIANPWWRGKRSQHSRLMRTSQFCLSGMKSMAKVLQDGARTRNQMVTTREAAASVSYDFSKFPMFQTQQLCSCGLNYKYTIT